jgi:hypothetical protein
MPPLFGFQMSPIRASRKSGPVAGPGLRCQPDAGVKYITVEPPNLYLVPCNRAGGVEFRFRNIGW